MQTLSFMHMFLLLHAVPFSSPAQTDFGVVSLSPTVSGLVNHVRCRPASLSPNVNQTTRSRCGAAVALFPSPFLTSLLTYDV